jgi:hypothetical protein
MDKYLYLDYSSLHNLPYIANLNSRLKNVPKFGSIILVLKRISKKEDISEFKK